MPKKPTLKQPRPKQRHTPYKILAMLLYGKYPWMELKAGQGAEPTTYTVALGPLASMLRVNASKLREYLTWLEEHQYLSEVSFSYGEVELTIANPPNLMKQQEMRSAVEAVRAEALQQVRKIVEATD